MKGIHHFGISGKLNPCYVGPFDVLEWIGPLAYRFTLPSQLAQVHDVFHVSILRKCVAHLRKVVDYQPLELQEDASYIKLPTCIMDRKEKVLWNSYIPYVKV